MGSETCSSRSAALALLLGVAVGAAGCTPATSSRPSGAAASAATTPADDSRADRLAREQAVVAANLGLMEKLKGRGLVTTADERGVVVTLPDTLFRYGRSELAWGARRTITELAEVVRAEAPSHSVGVFGYTDSVGPEDFNLSLSRRRAEAVQGVLVEAGLPRYLVRAEGLGEADPVAPNSYADGTDNPAGRGRNRRVEVVISAPAG